MLMLPPSMAPSTVLISTRRTRHVLTKTQGATSNYKNLPDQECEPAGHGISRSRGGLTAEIHYVVDGRGRPLAVVVTGRQRHDRVILPQVLADIRVNPLRRWREISVCLGQRSTAAHEHSPNSPASAHGNAPVVRFQL